MFSNSFRASYKEKERGYRLEIRKCKLTPRINSVYYLPFMISTFLSPRSKLVVRMRDGSPGSEQNGCGSADMLTSVEAVVVVVVVGVTINAVATEERSNSTTRRRGVMVRGTMCLDGSCLDLKDIVVSFRSGQIGRCHTGDKNAFITDFSNSDVLYGAAPTFASIFYSVITSIFRPKSQI
jgi:hypothetical protein